MRGILIAIFLVSTTLVKSQHEVAVDLNTALDNLFGSVQYSRRISEHFFAKGGFSGGNFGTVEITKNPNSVMAEGPIVAPYTGMNNTVLPGYRLSGYQNKAKGVGVEAGIGSHWKINHQHAIRVNFLVKWYTISDRLIGAYIRNATDNMVEFQRFDYRRQAFSAGIECFHFIKIGERLSGFYGVKIPYYFPLRSRGYAPQSNADVLAGIEPNLAVGFSYSIKAFFRKRAQKG